MNKFLSLGLSEPTVATITEMGFIEPTDIQEQAIPLLLSTDVDLVGLAQTGTGKTAAFGLPLIERVQTDDMRTQALVLAPTRELCMQIKKELARFGANHADLNICAVYGGVDIVRQMRQVKRGAHIIVATPGRLRDLMRRNAVDLQFLNYVVLDEADEMLNMGFKEEIDEILVATPDSKNTWLFSATMPAEVRRIASDYMTEPVELSIGERNTTNNDIDHQYIAVKPKERYAVLRRFLDYDAELFGLVFTRTRIDAQELAEQLTRDGYNADALHGDLSQQQRDRVMDRFRQHDLRILVATDVAARGIDVQDITHVFHFNIPDDLAFYTHRSGRTGRAGSKGISMVLLQQRDRSKLNRLEKVAKISFDEAQVPTGESIIRTRLLARIEQLRQRTPRPELDNYMPLVLESLRGLSKEDLAQLVAAEAFNELYETYRQAPPLSGADRGKSSSDRLSRLFINLGGQDLGGKKEFAEFVGNGIGVPESAIRHIDMQERHTHFEVESHLAPRLIQVFDGTQIDGRDIRLNSATERGEKRKGKSKINKGKRGATRMAKPKQRVKSYKTKKQKVGSW